MSGVLRRSTLERHMEEALELARRERFRVAPNPVVGAIVLDAEGNVVGRGAHGMFGEPHAEFHALCEAGRRAKDGTLIVTLEPCAHTEKKTPPCVPFIARKGIARVIAGCEDPNPATAGRAASEFARIGIGYRVGMLRKKCRAAIARYERHLTSTRPWTVAKWAMSVDGRIADGSGASRWISGRSSRNVVTLLMRLHADAVIVGRETVSRDDPSLKPADPRPGGPLRVVFDSALRIPLSAKLVVTAHETPTLIVAVRGVDLARRGALESAGVQVAEVEAGADGRVDIREAFRDLQRRGVRRALLEAGGSLTGACLRAGVVDQVAAFVAPVVLGGAGPTPFTGEGWPIASAPRLEEVCVTAVGEDALVEGFVPAVATRTPTATS